MRKGFWLVIFAVLATAAWATDLDPEGNNACGAGSLESDPSTIEGDDYFQKLYDNLNAKIGDNELYKITDDDDTVWNSGSLQDNDQYSYFMVKFEKPAGYSSGTLHWQVWTQVMGADVYMYRWNKSASPHEWSYLDSNPGRGGPPYYLPPDTKTYPIPGSYFDANGDLWLLFKAAGHAEWVDCDVCMITY